MLLNYYYSKCNHNIMNLSSLGENCYISMDVHYYASLRSWINPWKASAALLTLLLLPQTDIAFISVVVHTVNSLLWSPHPMFSGSGRPMAFHYFLTFSGIHSWEKGRRCLLLTYLFHRAASWPSSLLASVHENQSVNLTARCQIVYCHFSDLLNSRLGLMDSDLKCSVFCCVIFCCCFYVQIFIYKMQDMWQGIP